MFWSVIKTLRPGLAEFRINTMGNVAMVFAFAAVPLAGAVGAGVDFAGSLKDKQSMQSALDTAALAVAKSGDTLTAAQVQTLAQSWFNASFKEASANNITVTASYNANTHTAVVMGTGIHPTSLLKVAGFSSIPIGGTSTATMSPKKWPVCVQVIAPQSNHTLFVQDSATINFSKCLVQVNTDNWDAVESRNTAYIHSNDGKNCFVGNIHYGDVTPAKEPSCTLFENPFSNYVMPNSASNCDFTGLVVATEGTTINPGTYCGGLTITKSTKLTPGLYIMNDGDLNISGGGTVVDGERVAILFTGNSNTPGFDISSNAVVNLSPPTSEVGDFAGFVFYFDQSSASGCANPSDGAKVASTKAPKKGKNAAAGSCTSIIESGANVNVSGVVYLAGQSFLIQNNSTLTINPGTLIADMIVGSGNSNISLTGKLNTTTNAEIALQRQAGATSPVLIK